jgi:hypothetical protein
VSEADAGLASLDRPVDQLLLSIEQAGAAAGWGGHRKKDAYYVSVESPHPSGLLIRAKDVSVDAFWSVTMFNGNEERTHGEARHHQDQRGDRPAA